MLQRTESQIPFAHENGKKKFKSRRVYKIEVHNFPRLPKLGIHIGNLTQELSVSCSVLQMQKQNSGRVSSFGSTSIQ